MMKTEETLKNILGIGNVILLNKEQKKRILELEDGNNVGVMKCVKREFCFFCTHDSSFREPDCEIVRKNNEKIIFPPVGFHEIPGAISSSPSKKVHDWVVKELGLKLKDEASLLIGL